MSRLFPCVKLAVLLCTCTNLAHAADHVLTIGGGYSPAGNQVSLERNVLFFRNVLADLYPANSRPAHEVFFSDGDSPNRDVQYEDSKWQVPEPNRLLARVYNQEDDLGTRYRNHEIKNLSGPATLAAINRWFTETGSRLNSGDRLILYVTGHGGRERKRGAKPPASSTADNYLYLWNGDSLSVRELSELLDKLPGGVSVVAVMVQCYSGGFADIQFTGGKSDNGVAKSPRCGFFATMPDRVAAGCTADVNEADYEDYSTSFWAAIRGKTRTGLAVEKSTRDFDNDGVVTFAEAHAHVLLTDDSIDVPMTTSDRFLRIRSDPGASRGRLVSASDMLARLNALATPAERAVIEGLSQELKLDGQYRYDAVKELADSLRTQRREGQREDRKVRKRFDEARSAIAGALELRWPELTNRWNPSVEKLLREEGTAVVGAIKGDARFAEFDKLYNELDELSTRDDELEAKWAKAQRLLRTIERVALAHNIEKVADPETLAQYKALIAAENGTLARTR